MTVDDRFSREVETRDETLRRLRRDQAAVTWKSPQWHDLQREIDAAVAGRRNLESNLPRLRRADRSVTVRLVCALAFVALALGALVWFGVLSPWWLAGSAVAALLAYGVITAPR